MAIDIATRKAEEPAPLATLYRRMPRLTDISLGSNSDEARQKRCDRDHGHVLMFIDPKQIICTRCAATWRDEGF